MFPLFPFLIHARKYIFIYLGDLGAVFLNKLLNAGRMFKVGGGDAPNEILTSVMQGDGDWKPVDKGSPFSLYEYEHKALDAVLKIANVFQKKANLRLIMEYLPKAYTQSEIEKRWNMANGNVFLFVSQLDVIHRPDFIWSVFTHGYREKQVQSVLNDFYNWDYFTPRKGQQQSDADFDFKIKKSTMTLMWSVCTNTQLRITDQNVHVFFTPYGKTREVSNNEKIEYAKRWRASGSNLAVFYENFNEKVHRSFQKHCIGIGKSQSYDWKYMGRGMSPLRRRTFPGLARSESFHTIMLQGANVQLFKPNNIPRFISEHYGTSFLPSVVNAWKECNYNLATFYHASLDNYPIRAAILAYCQGEDANSLHRCDMVLRIVYEIETTYDLRNNSTYLTDVVMRPKNESDIDRYETLWNQSNVSLFMFAIRLKPDELKILEEYIYNLIEV